MAVAVLGLGNMGSALARRLLAAGREVIVWNRSPGRADALVQEGARKAASVEEAGAAAEVVLISLTDDAAVRAVVLPDGQPIRGLDGVLVDCSTVSPATTRDEAAKYGNHFVAAPILGAPQAVLSGKATFVVGGAPSAVSNADRVLSDISQTLLHVGDEAEKASVLKLLNNGLLMIGVAALADIVAAGQASGFDDAALKDLLTKLPVVAPGLHNRIDLLMDDEHAGWFPVRLGAKDLRLASEAAETVGVEMPVTDFVRQRYELAAASGLADKDIAGVIELLRRKA
jgi:3-hydroxyisobutyrate dehydrogenase-like beta-hydroxyacid dehydrogenase